MVIDLAANIALFEGGRLGSVPSVRNLLPPELSSFFTRSVCEALVAIATAPISGASVDLTTAAYTQATSVVQAAFYGHTTYDEALLELNRRLEIADNDMVMTRIKGAIDTLSKKGDSGFVCVCITRAKLWQSYILPCTELPPPVPSSRVCGCAGWLGAARLDLGDRQRCRPSIGCSACGVVSTYVLLGCPLKPLRFNYCSSPLRLNYCSSER